MPSHVTTITIDNNIKYRSVRVWCVSKSTYYFTFVKKYVLVNLK